MGLTGKKILIGISGSIAAYKIILLVRQLTQSDALVKVVMTKAAVDFVSPLVLSTLSRQKVLSDLSEGDAWANHVELGRWADLMVIAPLSCNTLAKMATGLCDNLLMAVYLSATCPVMVCPAMDEDMWHHPATRDNLKRLSSWGVQIVPVGNGSLASGLVGEGRMAEPEQIFDLIVSQVSLKSTGALQGKKVLVTAGPTYEPIDPVRFIGNHSSGKMGIALANELKTQGAEVHLILGPSTAPDPAGMQVVRVRTALEMFEATKAIFDECDIAVMTAAVADFRPAKPLESKYKKQAGKAPPIIELIENPDILAYCGKHKRADQISVGFALETNDAIKNAQKKLITKSANIIVLNSLQDKGAGFGVDTNKVTLLTDRQQIMPLALMSKPEVAKAIVNAINEYLT
jgi:phosphopantothenoylcysteine decarboxylase/phosphopantothenate--cysteine ligase